MGERGWVTITHDRRIRYKPNELAAVSRYRVPLLVVVGRAPYPELAGGPAAEYRVQRRKPGEPWTDVATAVDNDCLLTDQPEGIELDLRVIPVNQAGIGQPSATVTLVL